MLFTAAYQRVRLNIEVDLSKKFYGILQGTYLSVTEDASGPEEMVDGGPDIFPHSHNFHVPFFITTIRKGERDEKQQPFNPDT